MVDYYMKRIIRDSVKPIYNRLVEVAEGIFVVAGKSPIKEPPDPCWYIMDEKGRIAGNFHLEAIYIFSDDILANNFIETAVEPSSISCSKSWNDIVHDCKHIFIDAILDMDIEEKHFQFIPLERKDILLKYGM